MSEKIFKHVPTGDLYRIRKVFRKGEKSYEEAEKYTEGEKDTRYRLMTRAKQKIEKEGVWSKENFVEV